jgi:hypothetical protein
MAFTRFAQKLTLAGTRTRGLVVAEPLAATNSLSPFYKSNSPAKVSAVFWPSHEPVTMNSVASGFGRYLA